MVLGSTETPLSHPWPSGRQEKGMSHVKPRLLVLMAGATAVLALLVSLSIATAGTTKPAKVASPAEDRAAGRP